MSSGENKKIMLVCSSGGHLLQLWSLSKPLWENYDRVWVSFKKSDAESLLKQEKIYWGHYPTNRDLKNLARNLVLAWKILRVEQPDCVISTGAGIAVPFLVLGKLLGAKSIYIESFARKSNISLTGRLVYYFVDNFFVQSEQLAERYNKAVYRGTIY
ncbi:UDP-N-acetylglucosamine--LPS N-acetylglucosamine transferase [Thiohalobacter sp. COW1]|uniref:PssD/Cps14F family polysaccharide biosynthesis glycosyltransferase n=1 Tax=Thiohalobacter sp. COW1 TaxID=2795687 RepID=UPI00191679C7|nr:PssD/Cps14F family polysaccharide biosynthesis glycosyltransferase [Thiohalobacter sp. COW1]BCO32003.1 UDP-N-acetylglucosamine--LPS N-acetylglucosamine transferase [Thiohalobacter sp. COW1]